MPSLTVSTKPGKDHSRLEAEHDNIRAALAWALAQGDTQLALRLGGAMGRFWLVRGHLREGRRLLERALAAGEAVPMALRAPALHATVRLSWSQADFPAARAFAEASLAIQQELGDNREVAAAINTLGTIAVRQADYTTARARFEEVLALVRELGDSWRIAIALYNLGTVAIEQGDYTAARTFYEEGLELRRGLGDTLGIASSLDALGNLANVLGDHIAARALCEEGLALRRELGDQFAIAYSLWNLAMTARFQGDSVAARAYVEESLTLRREVGDRHGIAWSLNMLAMVAHDQGDPETARVCWEQSLALSRELDSTLGVTNCLVGLARLAAARAQPAHAARLLGVAAALRETIGFVIPPSERSDHERVVEAVRAALGEAEFTASWDAGRALSIDEAVALAQQRTTLDPATQTSPARLTSRRADVLHHAEPPGRISIRPCRHATAIRQLARRPLTSDDPA